MSIGQGGRGNQVAGAKEIVGRGDVVPGLVPVIRQAQQGKVREVDPYEEQGKNEPEWQQAVERSRLFGKYGHETPESFSGLGLEA